MFLTPARTEVAFWHGMDRLVGDLILPPWPGPHPAAVIARGPDGDDVVTSWQRRLAAAGIASFAYDPAGTGRSTGDWRSQQVGDRASEVLAAREVVLTRDDVARDSVALLACDDAGWAGIRAEAFAKVFAALVLLSVPVLDPVAVEQYRLSRRLERHGVGADEVGLALAVLRERFRRAAAGEDVARVLRAEAACRSASWYQLMPGLEAEDIPALARLVGVDPAAELAAVACPVLAMEGADDRSRPVQRSVESIRRALRSASHVDHACVVVPGAGSGLREQGGDLAAGVPELVVTWLDRRLGRRASTPERSAVEINGARRPEDAAMAVAVPAPSAPLSPPAFSSPMLSQASRHAAPSPQEPSIDLGLPDLAGDLSASLEPLGYGAEPLGYGSRGEADLEPVPVGFAGDDLGPEEPDVPTNGFFVTGQPLPPSRRLASPWSEGQALAGPVAPVQGPSARAGGSPHDGAGRVDTAGELRLPLTVVLPVLGRSYTS